ncbi:carboxy terminal-processing peptidase, partial [Acinetobacter baumannii]
TMDHERIGESSYDNPLPWTQIAPADFRPAGKPQELLPLLSARHQARVAQDKGYRELLEDLAENEALRKRTEISLNAAERKKEREAQEARLKA